MALPLGILAAVGGLKGILSTVGGFIGKFLGKDKELALAQAEITKAEIANAPQSKLLLWRSFFGWVMTLVFVLLVILMVASMFFPELRHETINELFKVVSQILFMLLGFGA